MGNKAIDRDLITYCTGKRVVCRGSFCTISLSNKLGQQVREPGFHERSKSTLYEIKSTKRVAELSHQLVREKDSTHTIIVEIQRMHQDRDER